MKDTSIRCPDCKARLGRDLHKPNCDYTAKLIRDYRKTPWLK